MRLVGGDEPVREEDTPLRDCERRIRTEAAHGLLREDELPEDETGGGDVSRKGSRLANCEVAAGIGRPADPEALTCINSADIEIVARVGPGGDRDKLGLDE